MGIEQRSSAGALLVPGASPAGATTMRAADQHRYGLPSALESSEVRATAARSRRCARPGGRGLGTSLPPLQRRDRSSRKKNR